MTYAELLQWSMQLWNGKWKMRRQLKKLNEECYELCEAAIDFDDVDWDNIHIQDYYDSVMEEIADVEFLLDQLKCKFRASESDIGDRKAMKALRTKKRLGVFGDL